MYWEHAQTWPCWSLFVQTRYCEYENLKNCNSKGKCERSKWKYLELNSYISKVWNSMLSSQMNTSKKVLVEKFLNFSWYFIILFSKVLLTTRNVLIANLAISDLLLSTTSIPLTMVDILYKYWPLGDNMVSTTSIKPEYLNKSSYCYPISLISFSLNDF